MNNLTWDVCDALIALGWTVPPRRVKTNPVSEAGQFLHGARVYGDAGDTGECLPAACPSKDAFITSADVLVLAKNQSMELLLSLNGFLTKRFLSSEKEGVYFHKVDNGDLVTISAEDFLRIYPDTLGKAWRVVRVVPEKQTPRRSLVTLIKDFLVSCFCLTVYFRTLG
jgi:hypothetical protein